VPVRESRKFNATQQALHCCAVANITSPVTLARFIFWSLLRAA